MDNCKCIEELTTLEEVKIIKQGVGTSDYSELTNKPQINGHELQAGDNSLDDIGAQPKGDYALKSEIPETDNFITKDVADLTNYTTTIDLNKEYAKKSEIPSLENYYTKDETYSNTEIDEKIKEASGVDLSAYLKKQEASDTYLDKTTAERDYASKTEVGEKADKNYVDTNFTKKEEIADFIKKDVSNLENYYTKGEIDTKTENFITKAVDDLTNYYTKRETYTQEEVNQRISAIKTGGFKSVEQLPESGEENVIYLVPAKKTFAQNIKDEFIWLSDTQAFEQIGSTQLDLENYVTDEKLTQKLQEYATKVDLEEYYKKTETYSNTEVDNKVDEETRDLLKTLSRELKPDEEDENGYSAQTLVNIKNKSDATELIVEIDNLDVKTNVAVNSVLGTLKGQDLEDRLKAVENDYVKTEQLPKVGTLDTTSTDILAESSIESLSGNVKLHKIAKSGSWGDLNNKPNLPNAISQLTNDWLMPGTDDDNAKNLSTQNPNKFFYTTEAE